MIYDMIYEKKYQILAREIPYFGHAGGRDHYGHVLVAALVLPEVSSLV